jgi:hypothetical protein
MEQTPSPDAMIFTGLHGESESEARYGFRMKPRVESAERLVDKLVGRLTIDRASGQVREIVIENVEAVRSGAARVEALTIRYTMAPVEGCCTVIAKLEQSVRGSALFIPGAATKVEMYERIEFVRDAPLDTPAKK